MRFFSSSFFSRISFPQAPKYPIGAIASFYEIHGDMHIKNNFVFKAGINDSVDYLLLISYRW
jgi:hypothetical protein